MVGIDPASAWIDQKVDQSWDTHHAFLSKSEISQEGLDNYVDFYFFLVEKFLSSFPNQYLDLGFDMLEEDLIVRGQNIINHFSEIFVESVLKKINKGNVKTNLS